LAIEIKEDKAMPVYMTQFSYTREAWAALVKDPEDRGAAFEELVEKFGGRLLDIYYCFGEYDGLVIYEAPDEATAMAAILAVIAPGHLQATKTTVLFTMEGAMEAMGKASGIVYPPPMRPR
jgi:uncharacterized protein with GYD domain